MIELTQEAAEQIKKIQTENNALEQSLRIAIEGGGCSGFQYGMGFDVKDSNDHACESQGISIIIDPESFPYLKGATLHFDGGFQGRGFTFHNPNAGHSCDCGKSFC